MRDRDGRAPARELVQRLLHRTLGLGVQRRGRLVEDQHGRVPQHRARDRYPLLLAAGEAVATLADGGVIALGQGGDELVDLSRPRGVLDLLVGGVGQAKRRFSRIEE